MVDKNKKQESSPDFNDEYVFFGLDVFRERLKERLNLAFDEFQKPEKIPEMPESAPPDYYEEMQGGDLPWQSDFLNGRDGPKGCAHNACLIFENDDRWKGVFAENVFTGAIDILQQPPIAEIESGELNDPHVSMIHVWVEQYYSIVIQDAAMKKALITVAAKNRYHPVKNYLNALPQWDGSNRCNLWLQQALGAKNEPDEYLRAVGQMFLIGAVRRIMNAPSVTKIDNMLIFEGLQGGGKSSLIEALFSPWHGDTPLPLGDKDAYINIRGSWGYEMAEMDSFNKATTSTAKSFISSHTDNFRPPFGTKNVKYPRQTVLLGSVNHTEYLTDSSGNRRYWPIWAYKIDLPWLKENREQIWAEALMLHQRGEKHWVDNKKEPKLEALIKYEQALREHPDAWEAKLFSWMHSGKCIQPYYSTIQILENVIEIDARSINKIHEMKLSNAMQKLDWKRQRKRIEGYHVPKPYLYFAPDWVKDKNRGYATPKQAEVAF
ncbi:MAG: hypothetical protein KAS93_08180 [Gammaproteobacteria bacterium]|nr:hypothetical protein [Gammaproteobacteria bacterium]